MNCTKMGIKKLSVTFTFFGRFQRNVREAAYLLTVHVRLGGYAYGGSQCNLPGQAMSYAALK